MRYSELTRKLPRLGLRVLKSGKGSDQIWEWPERQITVMIPYHATREIPPGTLRSILRQLDITLDELNKA